MTVLSLIKKVRSELSSFCEGSKDVEETLRGMNYWEADLMQGQDRCAQGGFTLRRRAGFPACVTRHSPVLEGADRLGKLFQQIAGDHGLGTELTAGKVPGQPGKVDPHHGAYGRGPPPAGSGGGSPRLPTPRPPPP